jgi:hypothetical protein
MDEQRVDRIRKAFDDSPHRRRLIAYGVLFAALLVYVGLSIFEGAATPAGPTEPALEDEAVPAGIREPLARVDPARLAGVRDGTELERAVLEREAAVHLLEQAGRLVYGDLEQLGVRAAPREELLADPAAHRGQPVSVTGTLQWQEEVQDDVLGFCVQGEVRDAQDQPWNFLVLAQLVDVRQGEVVRVAGFFLKHWDLLRPDGTRSSGPLVVGEEALRSAFRIEPVTELPPDFFVRVRDFDLADASQPVESPEFYELLSYVQNTPAATLFENADPPPEVRAEILVRDTGEWRGEPVRVSGTLLLAREVPLGPRGENPLGVPFIWELWLSSYQGTSRVLSLEAPEGLTEMRDIVDADGLYFRRYAYENTRDQPHAAAVVVAKRLQRYVRPENTWLPTAVRVVVGLVAGGAVLFVFIARADKRSAAAARQASIGRKKKLAARPGLLHPGKPADAPPPAPPAPAGDGGPPPP